MITSKILRQELAQRIFDLNFFDNRAEEITPETIAADLENPETALHIISYLVEALEELEA